MSKRKSFAEATDSLLAAFANAVGGAVNSTSNPKLPPLIFLTLVALYITIYIYIY
jgi:hypothetical protein